MIFQWHFSRRGTQVKPRARPLSTEPDTRRRLVPNTTMASKLCECKHITHVCQLPHLGGCMKVNLQSCSLLQLPHPDQCSHKFLIVGRTIFFFCSSVIGRSVINVMVLTANYDGILSYYRSKENKFSTYKQGGFLTCHFTKYHWQQNMEP